MNVGGIFTAMTGLQSFMLLFAFAAAFYYIFRTKGKRMNLPPGPKGWPLLGNVTSLNLHWERTLTEWRRKYGPVFLVRMAHINLVILGSFEAVQEAFVKKADSFSDRFQGALPGFTRSTGIIPMNYGHVLKEQRRFGLVTLREFGMGRRSIEPAILEKCSDLLERIDQKCDSKEAFTIDFMVYETVSSVVSQLVFNKDVAAERREFKEFLHMVITGNKYSAMNGITAFCPPLKRIPPFSWGYKVSVEHEEENYKIIQEEVDEHKRSRDPNHPRDFIDCFLNEVGTDNKVERRGGGDGFSDEQLGSVVRDLFLAGSETTSSTFCWLVLYVCQQPAIQQKLQEEIDSVLGENTKPSMWKSDEMQYTKAVIQETLRIRPVAPFGVPHRASSDETILGYDIPKGTLIIANIFGVHHDEAVWKNPEMFDPERHLDGEGKFAKTADFIPFSLGARQCIGMQLANIELFLLVATVFQRYSFELQNPEEVDMRGKNIFSLRPFPFHLVATRR